MSTLVIRILFVVLFMSIPVLAWGAHPLITDDAGTQGKGKFQLEVNGQYDYDNETINGISEKTKGGQLATILTYGIVNNADIVLTFPYEWVKIKEEGVTVHNDNGISDMILEVKWRFFDKNGLSLALKPGVRFPTGNDEKDLGSGRFGYQGYFISSKEMAPWAFHLNLGYIRNENKLDEGKNIWHASFAATYDIIKNLKVVGNIGIERNTDKEADKYPAFLIGGFIYSVTKNLDIDFGVKYGLTSAETDWSLMAGTTFRF